MGSKDECCSLVPGGQTDSFAMVVPGTVIKGRAAALAWLTVFENRQKETLAVLADKPGQLDRTRLCRTQLARAGKARRLVNSSAVSVDFKGLK